MYILSRPPWAVATAVQSNSGLVHIASGWTLGLGTETKCGRTLKDFEAYVHVSMVSVDAFKESFNYNPKTRVCVSCIRRYES